MQKGELAMRVQDEHVTFNVLKAIKFPVKVEECSAISALEGFRVSLGMRASTEDLSEIFPRFPNLFAVCCRRIANSSLIRHVC